MQYKANLIDDVQTSVLNAGVRDFTAATRSNVLTWLYGLPGDGGTPLRSAVMAVGRYYQRQRRPRALDRRSLREEQSDRV